MQNENTTSTRKSALSRQILLIEGSLRRER